MTKTGRPSGFFQGVVGLAFENNSYSMEKHVLQLFADLEFIARM